MLVALKITKQRQSDDVVSIEDAMQYLRTDVCDDANIVKFLIETAINRIQRYTGVVLQLSTIESVYESRFSERVYLSFCNNVSDFTANYELKGVDSEYYLDTTDEEIKLTYTAGYLTKEDVPSAFKMAILSEVAYLYENREAKVLSDYSKQLVYSYRKYIAV